MINQPIAQLLGNLALECFQLRIDEFDDFAGFNINQMIVMSLWRCFVASAAIAEIVALKDPRLLKQPHCTIDGSDRNAGVLFNGAGMQFFHIGVVIALRKHPRDDAALLGNAKPALRAKRFNIDRMVHVSSGKMKSLAKS